MMQHELEERLGYTLDPMQWDWLHMIYMYSPKIPDVGGKDVLAQYVKDGTAYTLHAEARAIAREHGWTPARIEREQWWGWYDVVEGMCENYRYKTLATIGSWLRAEMHKLDTPDGEFIDEYFSLGDDTKGACWPDFTMTRWIAVYPVRGGSEGWYVHVDALLSDDKRKLLFLAKTWTPDRAWEIVRELARLLEVM